MLDNMSATSMARAVELVDGRAKTEASGNLTLDTIREAARTGVDYVSVGAITHSAPNVDIAMDITT
jgi:nicotinate-nucleotide pyrophosphorylase (carboxylating)